jgi:hypothetical protein
VHARHYSTDSGAHDSAPVGSGNGAVAQLSHAVVRSHECLHSVASRLLSTNRLLHAASKSRDAANGQLSAAVQNAVRGAIACLQQQTRSLQAVLSALEEKEKEKQPPAFHAASVSAALPPLAPVLATAAAAAPAAPAPSVEQRSAAESKREPSKDEVSANCAQCGSTPCTCSSGGSGGASSVGDSSSLTASMRFEDLLGSGTERSEWSAHQSALAELGYQNTHFNGVLLALHEGNIDKVIADLKTYYRVR